MSREKKTMTVDEYRKKHKRCKTCMYAIQNNYGWYCSAKGDSYEEKLGWSGLKGCFCKLYYAKGERG